MDDIGKAIPSKRTEGYVFSLDTFLTNYNKLLPQTKELLFSGTPLKGLSKDMSKIASALGKMRDRSKHLFNPSGTAEASGAMRTISMGFGAVTGAGVSMFTGNPGYALIFPLSVGAELGSARFASKLLTNPRFVRWLSTGMNMDPKKLPSHIGRLSAVAAGSTSIKPMILEYLNYMTGRDSGGVRIVNRSEIERDISEGTSPGQLITDRRVPLELKRNPQKPKKETDKKKWGHARQAGLLGSPLPFIGYRKR